MGELEVLRVDVFTDEVLSGNPAWVVFDADRLDEVGMQRVAAELGPPVTAFVLRSKRADVRLRFFSPVGEEPISGHAVIGALSALADRGSFGPTPSNRRRLETAIGVLAFATEPGEPGPARIWMTQKKPLFARVDELKEVASALGVGVDSLFHEAFPLSRASTGLPCLLVPIRSLEAMEHMSPRQPELSELAQELDVAAVAVYSWSVMDPASTVHVRCFLPHGAVLEDVASGLPAGALGAYLVENDFIPKDRAGDMVIEQGHWLGRPSRILVRIDRQGSTVRRVEVGGSVRTSLRGKVSAP